MAYGVKMLADCIKHPQPERTSGQSNKYKLMRQSLMKKLLHFSYFSQLPHHVLFSISVVIIILFPVETP